MEETRGIVLMLDVWCGFRVHVGLESAGDGPSGGECYRGVKGGRAEADIVLR